MACRRNRQEFQTIRSEGSVERALDILGAGFTGHPKNAALREALRAGASGWTTSTASSCASCTG